MSWSAGSSRQVHQLISVAAVALESVKTDDDHSAQTNALVDYAMRLSLYAGLTAIFLMVAALIIKLMWNGDGEEDGGRRREAEGEDENSRLLPSPKKEDYGGTSQDIESGCNSSMSSLSSDDELYDGQICVICYDDQRNCFFVPCGHCIACHTCADRIMKEESKSCPICRGIIDKIKKLHIL